LNLELDQDQQDLVSATADVCAALAADWRSTAALHSVDHAGLKALADLGILGVRHPEPTGGGLGPVEAVLVAQPCGAALAPAPLLIWADLVGPAIPGVLTGEVSVTGTFDLERGFSHGGVSDVAIVVDERGAHAVDAESSAWEPLPQVDPLTPRAALRGGIPANAVLIADPVAVQQWRWQYRLLAAAHLVGVGQGAVDASVAYAKERHQFGRPIGSFQAVKHLLADAYTAVELARSQVLVASLCWAEEHPSAPDQAAAAAAVAARTAVTAAETAIQVHGGMGFTWEAVPHLYYKRALLLQDELGGLNALVDRLAGRDLSVRGPETVDDY
jgi:alkylation response protein AidB-like acyl-CoA dehydrogenase